MDLNSLKPKKFLGLGHHDLPHVGDLSRPYFITVGCSLTAGLCLDYKDTWSARLCKKLNMEHINLAMDGSSLDYQYATIIQAENILKEARFVVWMHTYTKRYHLMHLRHIIGDRIARRGQARGLEYNEKCFKKIEKFVELARHKKILHTNTWGYDVKTKLVLEKLICRKNKKYMLNNHPWHDRATDGLHAGPTSHELLADDLHDHISRYFADWHQ
jgi:hypothetical protein